MEKCFVIGGSALKNGVEIRGKVLTTRAIRQPDGEIILERKIHGLDEELDRTEERELIRYKEFKRSMISLLIIMAAIPVGVAAIISSLMVTSSTLLFKLIEGTIRVSFIVLTLYRYNYVLGHDVRKYHAAEHKVVNCYMQGGTPTIDEVKKYDAADSDCGISTWLAMVAIPTIFSLFIWTNSTVVLIVVEVIITMIILNYVDSIVRIGWVNYVFERFGIIVQKVFTLSEPDDKHLEVAIMALKDVVEVEEIASEALKNRYIERLYLDLKVLLQKRTT